MAYDEDLARRIRALLGQTPGLEERRMFGGLAFLVGGHIAIAASGGGGLLVPVAPEQSDALVQEPGVEPMVMRGRPMDGWVRVDAAAVPDEAGLQRWISLGLARASRLPPA